MTAELTEVAPHLLGRLDRILRQAVERMLAAFGPDVAADPFRGLYISRDDAARLLDLWPGSALEGLELPAERRPDDEPAELAGLAEAYQLSGFDLDVVLLALAPEVDLRYERVYAFLQDDVSRRRPSVDLALNLLCGGLEHKSHRRWHFTSDAPLVRHRLIRLVPDPNVPEAPLLAHTVKLDERIVGRLLGQAGLDPVLRTVCTLVEPSGSRLDPPLPDGEHDALFALVRWACSADEPLRLYFSGRQSWPKQQLARAVAAAADVPLLAFELTYALGAEIPFDTLVRRAFDEARTLGAVVYAEPWEALHGPERATEQQRLVDALAEYAGIAILAGVLPRPPRGPGTRGQLHVDLPIPTHEARVRFWQASLDAAGVPLADDDVHLLAGRFRLAPDQIADAVALARGQARWRSMAPDGTVEVADLFSSARAQSDAALDGLARKIEPKHSWSQIVLPEDTLTQLREMCQQVIHRHRVLDEWGFGGRLSVGKGVTALFAGPSGTGKTMAADIIARELGLDLYKIDLSGVVSKYIGETEKNLCRIFTAAENANAILFFDEADALFGKRSEVRDSHDRYANIEVAYLLQQMDQYEGVAILATNLRQNMDEAFVRRLGFAIDFPFPDEEQRARIWRILFPAQARRDADIEFAVLGRELRITGGSIKNIVLGAAFLAASANEPIGTEQLLHATRREYQKMGKVLSADLDLVGAGAAARKGSRL